MPWEGDWHMEQAVMSAIMDLAPGGAAPGAGSVQAKTEPFGRDCTVKPPLLSLIIRFLQVS